MWLAIPTEREEGDTKPDFWEQFRATLEQQGRELSELIIRIQSQVSWLVDHSRDELITSLNQLSGYFSPHNSENTETRDVRLAHVLLRVSKIHNQSWSEGKRRSVEVRTGKWYTESVDKNSPISVDEILGLPATQRRREFRFLLVYGITGEAISQALSRTQ